MKSTAEKNRILIILLTVILALSFSLSVLVGFDLIKLDNEFFENSTDLNNNIATAASPSGTGTPGSRYGKLALGSSYQYTDPQNQLNPTNDLKTVLIDPNQPHGSQKNPYVIDSVARWNNLATDAVKTSTVMDGKFFILTCDLSFSSITFNAIPYFRGTFYGLGHTLSGISVTTSSTQDYGAFVYADNATISDLNLENFKYVFEVAAAATRVAGLIGSTFNDSVVYNCHVSGTIQSLNTSNNARFGGIIGRIGSVNDLATTKIYRCSAFVDLQSTKSAQNSVETAFGGIVGLCSLGCKELNVNHCYAQVKSTSSNASKYWSGSIVGEVTSNPSNLTQVSTNNKVIISNCAGYIDDQNNPVAGSTKAENELHSSLISIAAEVAKEIKSIDIQNCYSYGVLRGTTQNLYAVTLTNKLNNATDITKTFNNVWSGGTTFYTPLSTLTIPKGIKNNTTSQSNLWSNAGSFFRSNASNIWTNTATIGTATTIADSPIRNNNLKTSGFVIKYCDYKNGSAEALSGATDKSYTPVTGGAVTLSNDPPSSSYTDNGTKYRDFVGWTADPTSNTKLASFIGSNYYGDINVYAIWDVNANDVTASIDATSTGSVTVEDNKATMKYGNPLTLSANIAVNHMPNPEYEYRWTRQGSARGTESSIELSDCADSATYKLEYKIKSSSMPLWSSDNWLTAGEMVVDIQKADLELNSFVITYPNKAYIGMPLSELTSKCNFEISSGGKVLSRARFNWYLTGADSNISEDNVDKTNPNQLKYTQAITLLGPSDKAANYNSKQVDVTFDVEYIKIIFDFEGVIENFEVNVNYGDNYSNQAIADKFDRAFSEAATQNPGAFDSVLSKVPSFDGVPLATYRNPNTNNVLKATKTIHVTFDDQQYTITYKFKNQNNLDDQKTESYGYGNYLISTSWYQPPEGYVLLGWKFTPTGETTERYWRFEADPETGALRDRVNGDVTLTADIVQLSIDGFKSLDITLVKKVFNALETVKDEDIIVVATFETNIGQDLKRTLHLNDTNADYRYTITYQNGPVFKYGDTEFAVTFNYAGSNTKKVTAVDDGLIINALTLDTSGIKTQVSDRYTGSASTAYEFTMKDVDIDYECFTSNYRPIGRDMLIGDPEVETVYHITAKLTPTSTDYLPTTVEITLTILSKPIDVVLVWESTSLPFSGSPQHPIAKVFRADNPNVEILDADVQYSGNTDAMIVGNGYRVVATLGSVAYNLTGDDFCVFSIDIAEVEVPTLPRELTYIGADIDLRNILLNFDPKVIKAAGDYIVRNASDSYSITFSLVDSTNYRFKSGNSTETLAFSVAKAPLTVRWDNLSFVFDGNAYGPKVIGFVELLGEDAANFNFDTQIIYTDERESAELGAHTIGMMFASNVTFRNNYVLSGQTVTYTILPGDGNYVFVTIEWSDIPEGGFIYNGEIQHPTFIVRDEQGNDITSSVTVNISGGYESSKYAKVYNCTATVSGSGDTLYIVTEGGTLTYEIKLDEQGNGADPGDKDTPPSEGGNVLDKIKEFIDNLIEKNFPLWQVATMAVAGLLTLIFLIKTVQYSKRKKKAKGEVKKLNAKTFAAIAPIFATDVAYAGLTNQIWSIIAFSLAGACVLMFLIMLITRHGWKKAELAKEAAAEDLEQRKAEAQENKQLALQERISQIGQGGSGADISSIEEILRRRDEEHRREMEEREERYRREEEDRRREDEDRHRQEMDAMKLMLANMMGRSQGNPDEMPIYGSIEDTDLLVQKVIAGLLPAVQQMMPDNTAYLTAPGYEESEELKNLVEEQNEQMRSMSEQISDLQNQIAEMSQGRVEAELLPDNTEEIKALTDKIAELQEQIANPAETIVTADNSEEIKALTAEMQKQFAKIDDLQNQLANMSQGGTTTVYVEKDSEDDDVDDEEEWDSILDEDDDDFVEAVVIEEDGTVKKTSPNFRMRLKQSSDKNREWYTVIKNMFCSQKGVTYRVYKRVEKIRYQGQVVAVIGIAKRSIKLWLALKPYEYDARRYHHKDVSDKPRFVDVPMYVRVGSDRALTRAQELILALFQELNMEERKRYNDRSIQELIFTLKHNKLLTNKQNKQLLCEVMHVHDCDVLDDETAEKCIEAKNVDFIDDSVIETVKLDDIDANFQDGNRITLDKLKKVGLVSEECTGYNVVADKRLTKPLIIVANDFTLTAVKLITLTGGRAIKLQQV